MMRANGSLLLLGRVEVEATGLKIERFLNISAQRDIRIESVRVSCREEQNDASILFFTTPSDFKRMKEVAKKTGIRMRIVGRRGLPFFLHRNRKRKLLISGMVSFFLFLYVSSFFIWDISFEGNHRFTDDTLNQYLKTISVYDGMKKSDISCENLEAGIRNRFTEITWVSAEIRGTRLLIHVKENEAVAIPEKPDDTPCDLIAAKAGTITGVVVRNGISQVNVGDYVEPGTQLVDGTIPIYDDSEVLTASHETRADGEIYAKTVYPVQKTFKDSRIVKARTGAVRRGFYVRIWNEPFYFLPPKPGKQPWEQILEQKQVKMLENFYLPICIGKMTSYEYEAYERFYTKEEAEAIGEDYMRDYMEKLSEKGIQILGSDGKIEHSESGWQLVGTIMVIENIAAPAPIPEDTGDGSGINEENGLINERN